MPVKRGRRSFWVFAAALAVLFAGGEMTLRFLGWTPLMQQTDGQWYRLLKSVRDDPESVDILFYGSSRTLLGVSPAAFDGRMRRLGLRTRTLNLGLNGAPPRVGLYAHLDARIPADVIVLEMLGEAFSSPMNLKELGIQRYLDAKRNAWEYPLSGWLPRLLGKHFFLTRGRPFFDSRKGLYRRMEYRDDGWMEAYATPDPARVEVFRQIQRFNGEAIPLEEARKAQSQYRKLFEQVMARGTKIVILRMPTAGLYRQEMDRFLAVGYHTDFLLQDKRILYIDANTHPRLKIYRPFENSHLNATTAIAFSGELAEVIHEWLQGNSRSAEGEI